MQFRRKIQYAIIIAVSVLAVIIMSVVYALFASDHIFNESKDHLTEIYSQVRTTFAQSVEAKRKLLRGWDGYITRMVGKINAAVDAGDDESAAALKKELETFIEEQKGKSGQDGERDDALWGFTNYYFVGPEQVDSETDSEFSHKVECRNVYGEQVFFRIRRSLDELLVLDRGVTIGMRIGVEGIYMLFAVQVKQPSTYSGMNYTAIGFSLDLESITNLLDITMYDNTAQVYIALSDGNVLLQTGNEEHGDVDNILAHLEENDMEIAGSKTIDDIHADWKGVVDENGNLVQKTETIVVTEKGQDYYFSYTPVMFGDWMLVGVVPRDNVNASVNKFRNITIGIMVAIFVLIATAATWIVITINRQRYKAKSLEVHSRENLLDMLTLNSNDMFVMFSPETFKADYVSANIFSVLGLDPEKVKADVRHIMTASDNKIDKPFDNDGMRALAEGKAWEEDVSMRNDKTGAEYWFHCSLYRREINGSDMYVLMFSDRTNDRSMRISLEEALQLAKNANAAKSNFLSNMSHDIRTPMNAIIGYATLLAKDADNPERVRDYTHKITYSGQHLLSLINDVLDMSKIESGKTSLNMEEFCFPEFVEELYSMMIAQTNAKNQTFDVHTKGSMPEYVTGDKLRLNQIMLNILSNAVKYTPEGGTISLRVEAMNQKVHNHAHLKFVVEDNGVGMSKEYLKTIFDPFSRETTAATKNVQGTGLGMAITKNIVDLMGGVISVESELGKGSTFIVELELAVSEGLPDDEDFWQKHNVTRVLVVDDEEDVCVDIKELMSDTGVDVEYALSGEAAVAEVVRSVQAKQDYHIVILDWKMPGMDGLETARQIRQKVGRDIPIMVLTSYRFDEIESEARDAGIDMFLSKPFFVSNFRRAVMQIRNDGTSADITPQDDGASLNGLRVLAAEDNEINAEILIELLEIEGVECDVMPDGEQAVKKFIESRPDEYDIIFMDIQMPVMDGYEAARAIRASAHKSAKTIPIVAMTANAFDDDVKAAIDAGMNAHLAKPIDMEKLKQIVVKLCGKK